MYKYFTILIILAPMLGTAQENQPNDPMQSLAVVVGNWEVQQIFWGSPDSSPDTTEFTARIYFLRDGEILVVDELSENGTYQFLGFHRYNREKDMYMIWDVSDAPSLA